MKIKLIIPVIGLLILSACAQNLRIMHTNDSHAAYEPARNRLGGYQALEYHLQESRNEVDAHMWLDAGDMQTGSIFSSMKWEGLQGGAVLKVFEDLDLDAATFGNHEFDVSEEHARALVERSAFPFLSANILNQDGTSFGDAKYAIFPKGKLKVGVIGLTIESLPERVKAENVRNLRILPYLEAIDMVLDEVDKASDLVVILSHNGWEADSLLATQLDDRVDIIIGGHSHIATHEARRVNGIYILSAGSHLQLLGLADLKVRRDRISSFSSKLIPLTQPPVGFRSKLAKFMDESIGELQMQLGEVVGTLPYAFEVDKFRVTPGSFWVAKAIREQYPEADLAMINNGGLRKHLPAAQVTLRDLHEYIPFGNSVVMFSCYGRDILAAQAKNREILETRPYDIMSLSEESWLNEASGAFRIQGKELVPDKVYRVVSHDYILSQWDKYLGFEPFNVDETGDMFLDAIIRQVRQELGGTN